ncbi:MAG: amidohydrolase family protein [Actinobacteria bacterium]|nr:amidohydrolase family protein [Actinomycetota bacterium]
MPGGTAVIDSDQHLVEYRGMWEDLADPSHRHEAIRMVDDDLGYTTLVWNGTRLGLVDVQDPGNTAGIGERHRRFRAREPAGHRYDETLPEDHWEPHARLRKLDEIGVAEAILFPNYGLLWERRLNCSLGAIRTNMAAWNRWCVTVADEGDGRLHPVAHLTLRDLDWLEAQLQSLARGGVRLAMIAPALVDTKPLSHPDLDRSWSLFVDHGVTPVFHVADQPRPFDEAWYTDQDDMAIPTLESVFLWTAAALACTDLIVNGVLERHPDLRIGIVELSAVWVPMYTMMLDGGVDFTSKLNGRTLTDLSLRPSEYFQRQVRVSSFSYELPARLTNQLGGRDILMCCSDYPHSEGTASPLEDYARGLNGSYAVTPDQAPGLFHDNAAFLLRQ